MRARAPPRPGRRRLLRRPVHRRRLPRRGEAEPRVRARRSALMYGEPDVWHALLEKLADTFAALRRREGARRRRRDPALRLLGRRALARRTTREFVAPYSARILAAVDVPTIHFGTGTATLLEEMAAAGGDVIGLDWRIPLDEGWAEVAATAPCRATSTPPCCSRRGRSSRRRRSTCSTARGRPARPHLQPRPRRPARHRPRRARPGSPALVHERTAAVAA